MSTPGFQRLTPAVKPAKKPAAQTPAVVTQAPTVQTQPVAQPAKVKPKRKVRRKVRRRRAKKVTRRGGAGGGWAVRTDSIPTLQPETFYSTAKAAERYARIADSGGWPRIPKALRRGSSGQAVALLRQRLALEGDLPIAETYATTWDKALTKAVRNYQYRVGLRQTVRSPAKRLRQ